MPQKIDKIFILEQPAGQILLWDNDLRYRELFYKKVKTNLPTISTELTS